MINISDDDGYVDITINRVSRTICVEKDNGAIDSCRAVDKDGDLKYTVYYYIVKNN